MKEEILKRMGRYISPREKQNRLREELHHLILQEIDRAGGFQFVSFVGGTALRIVYDLDRFSEDLDFSLSRSAPKDLSLQALVEKVSKSLVTFGLVCEIKKLKTVRNVQSCCFFQFSELLYRLDKQFQKSQQFAIKFKIDTNPPAGGRETVTPITGGHTYTIRHYDLPSLFAGKLHAILFRTYTKGRDLYDFLWYVGKKISPNLVLLENASRQTQNKEFNWNEVTLKEALIKRFAEVDFAKAKEDCSSFLMDSRSLELFKKEIFHSATERLSIQR